QEALIDMLKARREELLRDLGRPGTGIGPVGRPLLSGPGVLDPDRGEWQGNVLQGLALGIDAPGQLDQAANDHDAAADQVPDGEAGPVRAIADQRAVERGPDRAHDLGDGEEDGESLGPDLDREDLADREVTSARPGGREEEHDDPDEGLAGR